MSSIPVVATSKYHCPYVSKSETVNEIIGRFNDNSVVFMDTMIGTIFRLILADKVKLDGYKKEFSKTIQQNDGAAIEDYKKKIAKLREGFYISTVQRHRIDSFKLNGIPKEVPIAEQRKKYMELHNDNSEILFILAKHINSIFKKAVDDASKIPGGKDVQVRATLIEFISYDLDQEKIKNKDTNTIEIIQERISELYDIIAYSIFFRFLAHYDKTSIHS